MAAAVRRARLRPRVGLPALLLAVGIRWGATRGGVHAVLVEGVSMLPALRPGDALLVARRARVRAGDLVVARFAARPDLLVVKRAVRPADGGWWVESDNASVSDDSRRYGAAEVLGRVVLRYWPPRDVTASLRRTP